MAFEAAETIGPVKKIKLHRSDEKLRKDLKRYVQLAKDLGATDARAIPAAEVVIDPRTQMKCMYPKCHGCGTSIFCPPSPYVMKAEETEKIRDMYRWAMVMMIKTLGEDFLPNISDKERRRQREKGVKPSEYMPDDARGSATKIFKILTEVEAMAFYDGYYYATGFGSGPCKSALCQGAPCAMMNGEQCRYPLEARPAAEAVGIDSYATSAKLGWDIYPVGQRNMDCTQPHCLLVVTLFVD
jgi:predicted metal-binding protein